MSSSRLRVLHVMDALWGGGPEVSFLEYLHSERRDPGIEHSVVALRGDDQTRAAAESLPMATITIGKPKIRPQWADRQLVQDQISHFRPDVVHATLFRSTLAAARATSRTSLPLLISLTMMFYDVEFPSGSIKRRVGVRAAHALHGRILRRKNVSVHAVSQPVADRAVEVFGLDPTAFTVIHRGRADPREAVITDRVRVRRALGIPQNATVICYLAREHHLKNHMALIALGDALRRSTPDLRIVLAGRRYDSSPLLDAEIARRGLHETVLRLGHREDGADLLNASDLYVSPSLSEGFAGSIVEALGIGLPVVAFDVPGVRVVLGDAYPGLVPEGDSRGLEERVRRFVTDASLRAVAAAQGRARFCDDLEIGAFAERLEDLYRRLAAGGSAAHIPEGTP